MKNPKILDNVMLIQKCIVVRSDGTILAIRRVDNDHSRPGAWDLPGGGYEQGEDVLNAIKREIKEEVGINAGTVTPLYFANKIGTKVGLFYGDKVFALCYSCRNWSGEVKLSDEHAEYKWMKPDEFMQLYFAEDDGFFVASMKAYISTLR